MTITVGQTGKLCSRRKAVAFDYLGTGETINLEPNLPEAKDGRPNNYGAGEGTRTPTP
ncbi:hypothetical protein [Marivita sp.]|uniref:hypothetical protein n=1 Tax=Marivita sp. TaxID=2003365 RepID=UPI003F6C06D3